MTGGHSAPAGSTPVLDIGGNVGAVLVLLDGATPSGELWACSRADPTERFHTGVHLREDHGVAGWVALFPEVIAGDYFLLGDTGQAVRHFSVVGGEVTTVEHSPAVVGKPDRLEGIES